MSEDDFRAAVQALLGERANDLIHALDLGREFREICREFLKNHDSLPKGFGEFDDTPYHF